MAIAVARTIPIHRASHFSLSIPPGSDRLTDIEVSRPSNFEARATKPWLQTSPSGPRRRASAMCRCAPSLAPSDPEDSRPNHAVGNVHLAGGIRLSVAETYNLRPVKASIGLGGCGFRYAFLYQVLD